MTQEQYTEQLQARDREHETTLIGISEEISDYIAHMKEEHPQRAGPHRDVASKPNE